MSDEVQCRRCRRKLPTYEYAPASDTCRRCVASTPQRDGLTLAQWQAEQEARQ